MTAAAHLGAPPFSFSANRIELGRDLTSDALASALA